MLNEITQVDGDNEFYYGEHPENKGQVVGVRVKNKYLVSDTSVIDDSYWLGTSELNDMYNVWANSLEQEWGVTLV